MRLVGVVVGVCVAALAVVAGFFGAARLLFPTLPPPAKAAPAEAPRTAPPPAPPPAPPSASAPPSARVVHDDAEAVIWRFGEPDADDSSADEEPRPLLVLRHLIYEKERVSIFFGADMKPGDPPPYRGWFYWLAGDAVTHEPLKPEEVRKRLAGRDRGRPPAEVVAADAKLSGKP
jgi:hypothetical protein